MRFPTARPATAPARRCPAPSRAVPRPAVHGGPHGPARCRRRVRRGLEEPTWPDAGEPSAGTPYPGRTDDGSSSPAPAGGLGLETARSPGRGWAHVVLAVRNPAKVRRPRVPCVARSRSAGWTSPTCPAAGVRRGRRAGRRARQQRRVLAVPYAPHGRRLRDHLATNHLGHRADQPAPAAAHRPGRGGLLDSHHTGELDLTDLNWQRRD